MFKDLITHKGYLATLVGIALIIPVNLQVVVRYFAASAFSNAELSTVTLLNVLAMIWVMLPTKISFQAGKFKFTIED